MYWSGISYPKFWLRVRDIPRTSWHLKTEKNAKIGRYTFIKYQGFVKGEELCLSCDLVNSTFSMTFGWLWKVTKSKIKFLSFYKSLIKYSPSNSFYQIPLSNTFCQVHFFGDAIAWWKGHLIIQPGGKFNFWTIKMK